MRPATVRLHLPYLCRCCWAPAAVDRYLLPARRRSAANPPHAAVERTMAQTDGRTSDRYIDRACTRAVSAISRTTLWSVMRSHVSLSYRHGAVIPYSDPGVFGVLLRRRWSYRAHDSPRWVIEPSRRLLLERGMLFRRLFVMRHRCCSSAATSRRHCFSHRTLHHSVQLYDRLQRLIL